MYITSYCMHYFLIKTALTEVQAYLVPHAICYTIKCASSCWWVCASLMSDVDKTYTVPALPTVKRLQNIV
jgi:hypothetical protein